MTEKLLNAKGLVYICGCVITLGGPCRCPQSLPEGSSCTLTEEFCSQSSMHPSLVLLFLHLWGNVGLSLSQTAQQCPAIHISVNIQVTGDPEEATYGNVLRFSCKSSTEILYGPTEIYCDENGMWSDNPPRCEAVKCKVPEIEHGTVTGDIRVYNEHEILYFECNARYGKSEERPSRCIKMGQRADWSPTPACEPIKCKLQLSQLEGFTYEPAHRNVFSPGETLRVTCEARYWIFNPREISTVITCRDDGQWTSDPTCKEVTCSRPYDQHISYWDNYWQRKKTLGDTVRYSCTSGYKSTNGATRATCTRDGWTPDPLCQEITCDRREIPNAAIENMKEKYKVSERANYVCNEGYRGRFTLTCTERGWDKNPQCTEITCDPPRYRNADIVNYKTIYRYKEQAVYECRDGYRGGFTLTCTEQGWIGRTQCTELMCDRREIPNAAIQNIKEKYTFSEQVHYVCNEGYRGRFTLTCTERGWDKNPQCTEELCRKLDNDDAYITTNDKETYSNNEQVQYSCRNDTEKQFTATCERGVWAGIKNCTELVDCVRPPHVPGGDIKYTLKSQYSHNERVEYMCQNYYTLEGEPYKICVNGEWTGQIRCLKPCIVHEDDFRQHNITLKSSFSKYLLHDEAIAFTCARGAPVGAAALRQRCNSGTLVLPTCY